MLQTRMIAVCLAMALMLIFLLPAGRPPTGISAAPACAGFLLGLVILWRRASSRRQRQVAAVTIVCMGTADLVSAVLMLLETAYTGGLAAGVVGATTLIMSIAAMRQARRVRRSGWHGYLQE